MHIGSLVIPRWLVIAIVALAVVVAGAVLLSSNLILQRAGITAVDYEVGSALSLDARIDLPVSNLVIEGGTGGLVSGSIGYELPAYAPQVSYEVASQEASLYITQSPRAQRQPYDLSQYVSSLAFNRDIPLAFTLTQRNGSADLRLSDLTLTRLEATFGVGQSTITLDGAQPIMTDLRLLSDEGADTVNLNCDCASLVEATIELGQDADTITLDGSYPSLTSLRIDGGVANDTITVNGSYPAIVTGQILLGGGNDRLIVSGAINSASNLIVNIGTGDDTVSLVGAWSQDETITVISEGDTTSIQLPSDVGVRVGIASRSNTVSAEGFTLQGTGEDAAYVNAAYGTSPITLTVNVNATPNENITLTLADAPGDAAPIAEATPAAETTPAS